MAALPLASAPRRFRRSVLALTTAMGSLSLFPGLAHAQTGVRLPTEADVIGSRTSGLGSGPEYRNGNNKLTVSLNARNTVIDWNGFNIPEGGEAAFENDVLTRPNIAVLNRDLSGKTSQLLGKLTSDDSVAVWVYNPNGFVIGSRAAFTTGSLVLTALDVNEADFLAGGGSYRMTPAAGSEAEIIVEKGASINVDGGTRGLVMVAPKINAYGDFKAVGQGVAFVTATDVTLNYQNGSPLSVTLNRGTAVKAPRQYVRGTVSGNEVIFALASADTITDSLLQVDANVTATSGSRGIILSAGGAAAGDGAVTIGETATDVGGVAALTVTGALLAEGRNADILAAATGAATLSGTIEAAGDVTLSSAGALTVSGGVDADGDVAFTGAGITLGGASAVTQRAGDQFAARSTDGDIVGTGALTLRAGSTTADSLRLETQGTVAGDIALGADSRLIAGGDRNGGVTLRVRDATNRVSIGDVAAQSLQAAVGTGTALDGLALGAAVSIGDVDVRDALTISAAEVTAGALKSDRGVSLTTVGAVSAESITARNGSAVLAAGGAVQVTGAIGAAGNNADISVTGAGTIGLADLVAQRDVLVRNTTTADAASIAGNVRAGRNYVVEADRVELGGSSAVRHAAAGEVRIAAGRGGISGLSGLSLVANSDGNGGESLTLATDTVRAASSGAGDIDFAADTSLLGGSERQSDLIVRSADAAGAVRLGDVAARGLLGATDSGALSTGIVRTGAVSMGDVSVTRDLILSGETVEVGDLASSAGLVRLGATGSASGGDITVGSIGATGGISLTATRGITAGALTAGGAISADAVGALTLSGDVNAGSDLTLGGGGVRLGGREVRSGGAIDILSTSDGIQAPALVSMTSTSRDRSDFIRLQTTGANAGIEFAQDSAITAGADRSLNVRIFNGGSGAITLGDVSARSLGALSALNGDATAAAIGLSSDTALSFGRLQLVDGFAASSLNGDLSVEGISVTGAGQGVELRAENGTLSLGGALSVDGAVTLASGEALTLGDVESRSRAVSITTDGALSAGTLKGASSVSAAAAALVLDGVEGGNVALTATTGDLSLGSAQGSAIRLSAAGGELGVTGDLLARTGAIGVDAGGDVVLGGAVTAGGGSVMVQAGGSVVAAGDASASGNMRWSGTALEFAGAHTAGGSYVATSTTGAIVGRDRFAVLSNADGVGDEGIALTSARDIDLGTATLAGGRMQTAAVGVTANGLIQLGDVSGAALTLKNSGQFATRAGDLTLRDTLSVTTQDAVTFGDVTAGQAVTILAGSRDATVGDFAAMAGRSVTTSGAVKAASGAAVTLGRVESAEGDVSITAGGQLFATRVTAGGAVTLTGGAGQDVLVAEGVTAQDDATVISGRNIRAPFVRSLGGDLTVSAANGAVLGYDDGSGIGLAAGPGGAFSLTVGTDAQLGDVVGGNISITATSIRADRIDGGTEAIALRATSGDLTIGGPVVGGDVTLQAAGQASLGSVTASGALVLGGDQSLSFGTVSGASILATGGSIRGDAMLSTGTIDVTGGAMTIGRIDAGNALTIDAQDALSFNELRAGSMEVAAGSITGGRIATTGAASLRGTGVDVETADVGGALAIDAGTGDLSLLTVTGGAAVTLAGARATLGTVTAAEALALTIAEDLSFGELDASSIEATAGVVAGQTLRSTGAAMVVAQGVSIDTADVAGALGIDAGTGALSLGTVTGGGTVTLAGRRGTLGNISTPDTLTLTIAEDLSFAGLDAGTIGATAGTMQGQTLRSTGAARIAAQGVGIETVDVAGALAVDAGTGEVSLGSVTGGDLVTLTGGRGTLGSVAANTLALRFARDLSFTELSAGAIQASAATMQGDMLRSTGAAAVTGQAVSIGTVDVAGALGVDAGSGELTLGMVTNGSTVTLAGGRGTLGSVDAADALDLAIAEELSFTTLAGATIQADVGTLRGQNLRSAGAATIAGRAVSIETVDVAGAFAVDAGAGALTLGTVTGGSKVTLIGGRGTLGSVAATDALALTFAEDLSFTELRAGSIQASARTLRGTALRSTGAVIARAQDLSVDTVDVAGALELNAGAGGLALGTVTGGSSVTLAGGSAALGSLATPGTLALTIGGGLRFDELSGGSVTVDAGAVDGRTLRATRTATIDGNLVAIDTIDAGGALAVTARGGNLTLGAVTGGRAVTLAAAGNATLGSVTAADALAFDVDGALAFAGLSGSAITGTAGSIAGQALRAGGAVDVRARTLSLGSAEAGGMLALQATQGALTLGSATASGDVTLGATELARVDGAVSAGGDYRVTGGSVQLGGEGVVQSAGGQVRLIATTGDLRGASGLTLVSGTDGSGGMMVLDAAGGVDLGDTVLQVQPQGGAALALRAGSGRAIRLGSVQAASIGGFDGAAALDTLVHDGAFTAGDLDVGRMRVELTGGDLQTGRIDSSGAIALAATGGTLTTGDVRAASFDARSDGAIAFGAATIGGAATIDGASITAQGVEAGTLAVRTPGTLGAADGGRVTLRTTSGDLSIDAGTARLDRVDSAAGVGLRGDRIDVAGPIAAARQLLVEARETLAIADATAGGELSLGSTGSLRAGALNASGALSAQGADVTLGSASAGGTMGVTSSGAVSIGSATANGITIDAAGTATLGALSGGASIDLAAGDADLSGDIRATSVRFATHDPATTTLRVGDGTADDGLRLSQAEVARVSADTLRFDAGSGAMEIGTLALAPAAGSSVQMLSQGAIRVTGALSSTGTGRAIRIGGDAGEGSAETIRVEATSSGGGRLLLDGADLELRGNRIAVGLGASFLDTLLPGEPGKTQAVALVGNPNSALYNSQLGGGFYDPNATTTVAARTLTVRFGDYALFQNTAIPGQTSGVVLGGTGAETVLRVSSYGPPALASLALFGSLNTISGAGAALLGGPIVDIDPLLLGNTRINGCLSGSGAGCLTTIVIQPTLQVFDWDSQTVFGISQDVALPFTPIIGGNNEELLTGLPALAPETPEDAAAQPSPREPQE
ncbi:filamentous hemagglutinin N-terminal domain-containing protein [Sphingomonas sp. PL-96]|uniref:filamentous hemagglutinin N-terminal domain-containing protein n=1 Tax=Sphingomonas sp. PL-96 TaxID=2887201 RepID=UPI001E30D65B|nr:filamentous hemagglutinin N-terminal domain-containing protein [Sphingomonas sp. PL-96]MCC2975697.1 filamentous hemagglutinin N-terminal domain-containing protein [Sphingomonas sp. PL-96]